MVDARPKPVNRLRGEFVRPGASGPRERPQQPIRPTHLAFYVDDMDEAAARVRAAGRRAYDHTRATQHDDDVLHRPERRPGQAGASSGNRGPLFKLRQFGEQYGLRGLPAQPPEYRGRFINYHIEDCDAGGYSPMTKAGACLCKIVGLREHTRSVACRTTERSSKGDAT
jgi:hypothetical protein